MNSSLSGELRNASSKIRNQDNASMFLYDASFNHANLCNRTFIVKGRTGIVVETLCAICVPTKKVLILIATYKSKVLRVKLK